MSRSLIAFAVWPALFVGLLIVSQAGCQRGESKVSRAAPQGERSSPAAEPGVSAPAPPPRADLRSEDAVVDEPSTGEHTGEDQARAAPASQRAERSTLIEQPAAAPETRDLPPAEPQPLPAKSTEPPPETAGMRRLLNVWIDREKRRVAVAGEVCRQEGQLEMFACLRDTKEHESVVSVDAKAVEINAALLAVGAQPGHPVKFQPEYQPAAGPEVEVTVYWTGADGQRRSARGQHWVRNIKTGRELDHPWVFAGSGFWRDDATGQEHFMAEDGDFICVSNFTTALLDLPIQSSQDASDLLFEAFTGRVPPVGTPVLVVLEPKLPEDKPSDREPAAAQPGEEPKSPAAAEDKPAAAGDSTRPGE